MYSAAFIMIGFTPVALALAENKPKVGAVLCFRETYLGKHFHAIHVINSFILCGYESPSLCTVCDLYFPGKPLGEGLSICILSFGSMYPQLW